MSEYDTPVTPRKVGTGTVQTPWGPERVIVSDYHETCDGHDMVAVKYARNVTGTWFMLDVASIKGVRS